MPRKKTEVQVTCFDIEAEKKAQAEAKPVDYGTGRTRINNMMQAGYTLNEIMEEKKNE